MVDINNWLTSKIDANLKTKNICKKLDNFDDIIKQRVKLYNCDLVIEGHFHQNILSDDYINLPSLCCDKQYMIYKNNQFSFHLV